MEETNIPHLPTIRRQVLQYFVLLEQGKITTNIAITISNIQIFMEIGDFTAADQVYFDLSIGNATWHQNVPDAIGEDVRSLLTSFKKIMTFYKAYKSNNEAVEPDLEADATSRIIFPEEKDTKRTFELAKENI
eukprot:TRINITY_DN2193_c0_g1_i1.p1 TRINITY_DN2193_c0_g1~~TRINITY_DN2193_c0_g1_i1.p1  ORF type:complete len:133 (+),score=32.97 TRINITY_DN2193_c0_g1_i1:510-908(+)